MSEMTNRIEDLLHSKKMRITDLLRDLKISSGAYTRWKNGSAPSVETAFSVSQYLNISLEYLLTGKDRTFQDLPEDERAILQTYRKLSSEEKSLISKMMSYYAEIVSN